MSTPPARHIPDEERRFRLARRQAIAPGSRVQGPFDATTAMTVLHATDLSTVYLSVVARADGATIADIDRAFYEDRTLVKQLAMRRTLFVFPHDLVSAALGSSSARVADTERRKIAKNLAADGVTDAPEAWMDRVADEVADLLDGTDGLLTSDIRKAHPDIDIRVDSAPGTKWGGPTPLATRFLTWMGADGRIVRGVNDGHWRVSRHRWTSYDQWLPARTDPSSADEGYAELVRRWLRTFGPGTETDIVWWLGATKTIVRQALADVGAVSVSLDSGSVGWVLADDLAEEEAPGRWAALLPTLDPTTMGWKERDFYVDPALVPLLFDTAGNGGTTAWVDGRIVGCWVQDDDGSVHVVLSAPVDAQGKRLLDDEAERLTTWMDGAVVANVYKSLQMKQAALR